MSEIESIHERLHDALKTVNAHVEEGEYNQAREMLESLVDSGAESGYAYLALGEICKSFSDGLSIERARDYLLQAIELGEMESDDQVVVAARAGLAGVETLLGNPEEAERHLQRARDGFSSLEEVAQWEELGDRLERNRQPIESLLFTSQGKSCCASNNKQGRCNGRPPTCRSNSNTSCNPPSDC